MNTINILFYTSWIYLSTLIIIELFCIDLPAWKKSKTDNNFKANKAVSYYKTRKNIFLYKITPLFCLLQVISIIANIVLNISEFWISPILLLVLAITLIIIQTKKNVQVVLSLNNIEEDNFSEKQKALSSILTAHVITLLLLIGMLFCYLLKF
ncbi:MAG: hypothetical protein RLZZ175_3159 [Bacteroidota bacterium]|jgi:hypothetical protein